MGLSTERVQLSADSGDAGQAPSEFVERSRELALLTGLLEGARRGDGALAVIEGEAGIGKTRLLAELVSRARAGGLVPLAGRGAELEHEFSFGLVRQMFEPVLAAADADARGRLLEGAARLAAPLFDAAAPPTVGPADAVLAVVHGLYWLTAALAERSPLLIAVDDAHWADEASLRWVAYLAARLEGIPAMVAIATRADEPAGPQALLDAIVPADSKVVRLGGLSASGVERVVRADLPDATDALCAACYTATRGNPLYLREILRALRLGGRARVTELPQPLRSLDTHTLGRAVLARLARLSEDAVEVARAVAVLGSDADLPRIAALADLDQARAANVIDQLASSHILIGHSPVEFVHPIVRSAIYGQIGDTVRARLHAQAAAMLTRSNHPAERICVHLLATDPELVPSAVSTLRTAASDALSSGAPEIAVDLLTRALAEPTDAETRADLLYDRGFARLSKPGFDPDAVKDIETAIGMTHDPRRKAERALTACRSIGNRGVFGSAFDVCKIGLEGVASTDDPIIVRLLTEAITLSRNAPATADAAAGYRTLLRSARRASGLAPFFDIEQAWELATEGRDADLVRALVLRALDGGLLQFGASPGSQGISFFCLMWTDEPQVVEALTTEALAARSRSGSPDFLSLYSGVCLMWRAVAGCYAGSLRRAEADAAVVVEQNARFEPLRSNGFPPAAYVHALVERGRLDEAAIVLQRAGLDADLPDSFEHLLVLDSRARLRIARHDRARAAADLRQCERITNAIGMANPACCPWRSQLALVLSSLGEHDEAVSLAREEVARARAFGANRALGIALRAWAQVGEAGERLELLREAVAVLDGSPARLEHARAMVDLGRALRQAGERSEAQQQLRRAMDLAERCGASPLAERAREELVVAGARPRRRRTSGSDALTAGERRVAEMAAAGMTNREIAQALFITTKTVAHHLTHIYAKLEIDGRQSLAAALSTDA